MTDRPPPGEPAAGDPAQPGPVGETRRAGPLSGLDDPEAAIYTVGQAATALGATVAALRRLDAQGVLTPARSDGGQRRYSRAQLERASRLLRQLDDGVPAAAAERILALEDEVSDLRDRLGPGAVP